MGWGGLRGDRPAGVELGKDGVGIRYAAEERRLTGDDRGTAGSGRRYECRREVAAADVLLERPLDLGGQIIRVGNEWIHRQWGGGSRHGGLENRRLGPIIQRCPH